MERIRNAFGWARHSLRLRRWVAGISVALGFALLLVGIVNGFVRVNVYETQPFAANAVEAFEDDSVKQVIAAKLTDRLVQRLPSIVRGAEPVLAALVLQATESRRFEQIFREAAVDANRVFFGKDAGQPALDLSDAGPLITSIVEQVDPGLAKALPDTLRGLIVDVSSKPAINEIVRVAEGARTTTFLWPALAIVFFAIAILVSLDRRRSVLWIGLSIATSGVVLWVGSEIAKRVALSGRASSTETDAAQATLNAYLSDAPTWGFVLAIAGAILTGAAISAGRPGELSRRLRTIAERARATPSRSPLRILRALAIGALGALIVLERGLAVSIVVVAVGFALLLACLTEIMRVTERTAGPGRSLVPWLVALAAVIALIVAGILVLTP